MIALVLLACQPVQPLDTDTDGATTGTADTAAPLPHWWTQSIQRRWRDFADVAFVDPDQGLIGVVREGGEDIDQEYFAFGQVAAWPLGASELDPRAPLCNEGLCQSSSRYGRDVRVSALPGASGDDLPHLGVWLLDEAGIIAEHAAEPSLLIDWDTGARMLSCDVNDDGQPDLCATNGVDFGPQDGVPDRFWGPLDGFDPQHDAVLLAGPDGADLIVSGASTVSRVDAASDPAVLAPSWTAPGTDVVSGIATLDPDGDGTDALLLCSGPEDGPHTLRLLDDLSTDNAPFATVPGPCTDLEIGDFDGDGQPEIAVGAASTVTVIELDGTVRATHLGIDEPGEDELGSGIDSADVDGDGRDDLLVGAPGTSTLYLTLDAIPGP